jgi:hypothetical protein
MKIRTHWPLPEGKSLNFKLILGAHSICLTGRVVYNAILLIKESVSGIQFVDTSPENDALLQEHLSTFERWRSRGGAIL